MLPLTLTRRPPDIHPDPETDDRLPLFSFGVPPLCWRCTPYAERSLLADNVLRGRSGREQDEFIEHFFGERGDSPDDLADLVRVFAFVDRNRMRKVLGRASALHPGHTGLAILRAEEAVEDGRWGEVIETLQPMRTGRLNLQARRHLAHLLGMAMYAMGDPDAAFKLWKNAGPVVDGAPSCELTPYLDLARPLRPADRGPRAPLVRRLLAAVRAADEALELGDAGAALEAADCNAVWRAGEVQSLARLAEAFLQVEPEPALQRFRKAMALSLFVSHHDENVDLRNELLLSPGQLDRDRLDDLRARSLAWLDLFDAAL